MNLDVGRSVTGRDSSEVPFCLIAEFAGFSGFQIWRLGGVKLLQEQPIGWEPSLQIFGGQAG